MSNKVSRVVILGGGAAGWLTAGIIAAENLTATSDAVNVTLVESPDVSVIGVGEGTWPTMRSTIQKIGLSESDFIRECDASFKQGSKFVGWKNDSKDFYYHPFSLPQGFFEANLIPSWQEHFATHAFADQVCPQPHLCEMGLAPKQAATPEFAAVMNYGYHLNSGKFGELLKKHCVEKLKVNHIVDHVMSVKSKDNNDIDTLQLKSGKDVYGDLFVDCSGMSSLLIGKHYNVPFESKDNVLFNNAAMAVQVPYRSESDPIASATISTAQKHGWIWDIGLSSRRGVGYVYSTKFAEDQDIEKGLYHYISTTAGDDIAEQASFRKICFAPGHRQTFWQNNCVAVGMAAGFIEPLEASALALVEFSAKLISQELPQSREMMDFAAKRFNKTFRYRWDRVIDFLKLHYVLSSRDDSDYWLANTRKDSLPDSLAELLQVWQYRAPNQNDFPFVEELFPAASYQYVLYGMGFVSDKNQIKKVSEREELANVFFKKNQEKIRIMRERLPSNRELINTVFKNGLPLR